MYLYTMKFVRLFFILFLFSTTLSAQTLKPGFDALEFKQMLLISGRQGDTPWVKVRIAVPDEYKMVYRSAEIGLDNRWDFWEAPGKSSVISVRGTTSETTSWLANFYAAMIPAKGALKIKNDYTFNYQFAADSNALVHTGWTIGLAFLWPDIKEKMMDRYNKGQKEFIVMGHSQGGGIAFLLHSHLYYLQQKGELPADMVFKTYCSAAPKPGNLYYAYDFDFITRNGIAFRVVNTSDWVPEMPISIQTLNDLNKVNPFADVKPQLKKMKPLQRMVLKHVYKDMTGSVNKANKTLRKYLDKTAYKYVKKNLVEFDKPNGSTSQNYTVAGHPVILAKTPGYDSFSSKLPQHSFTHHFMEAYLYLLEENYIKVKN